MGKVQKSWQERGGLHKQKEHSGAFILVLSLLLSLSEMWLSAVSQTVTARILFLGNSANFPKNYTNTEDFAMIFSLSADSKQSCSSSSFSGVGQYIILRSLPRMQINSSGFSIGKRPRPA